jgi:hypothetical protein
MPLFLPTGDVAWQAAAVVELGKGAGTAQAGLLQPARHRAALPWAKDAAPLHQRAQGGARPACADRAAAGPHAAAARPGGFQRVRERVRSDSEAQRDRPGGGPR